MVSTMSIPSHYALLLWLLVVAISLITGVNTDNVVYVTSTVDASTTVQATPTAPSPASYTSFDGFKETVLRVSNEYRRSHDANPLVWNETLVKYARDWAEACIWKHSVRYSVSASSMRFSNSTMSSTVPMVKISPLVTPMPLRLSMRGAMKGDSIISKSRRASQSKPVTSHNWCGNRRPKWDALRSTVDIHTIRREEIVTMRAT